MLFEAFGPSRFAGWARGGERYTDPYGFGFEYEYQPGEPMGRPLESPFIRIMATEENQSNNTYRTVLLNLTDSDCPLFYWPGHNAGKREVYLDNGGEIRTSTASSASKDGGLETAAVMDETHLYDTPELREMRDTVVGNMWKRQANAGTLYLETTTMFEPGANSAAEQTFTEADLLAEGRKKRGGHRLYFDHRWGECADLADEPALRKAIRDAYGDAMAWMDEDALVDKVYDTRTPEARVRRYMLNGQTSSKDAWLKVHQWQACGVEGKELADGDLVVLGGDGSWNDDATAICAVRVSDGHMELLGCWEKPEGAEGEGWQVDREAVDACVADAMRRFDVAGFYFDPPHWSDYLAKWTNEWGHLMRVQANAKHPLDWWTNRPTPMVQALAEFKTAILEKRASWSKYPELETVDPDSLPPRAKLSLTLKRHALNARTEEKRSGLHIRKETPKSPKKIDGIMAATLAWQCRQDAIEAGVGNEEPEEWFMPRRIR